MRSREEIMYDRDVELLQQKATNISSAIRELIEDVDREIALCEKFLSRPWWRNAVSWEFWRR